jgi:hypothetical protein
MYQSYNSVGGIHSRHTEIVGIVLEVVEIKPYKKRRQGSNQKA